MDKEHLIARLKHDYNYDFDFRSFRILKDPGPYTMITFLTRFYTSVSSFTKKKLGEIEDAEASSRGVRIIRYRDALFHSVIALRFDPPCFDSGDRTYDSRHTLYLIHGIYDISAVYCVEGYQISELVVFDGLRAASPKLIDYMKQAGFPVGHIKPL